MKTYLITIERIISRGYYVRANSREEAEMAVRDAVPSQIDMPDGHGPDDVEDRVCSEPDPQDWEAEAPDYTVNEDGELAEIED